MQFKMIGYIHIELRRSLLHLSRWYFCM